MNEEEDSAFVDSFFLPGGILDPEYDDAGNDQKDDSQENLVAHVPFAFLRSAGPLGNPWADAADPVVTRQQQAADPVVTRQQQAANSSWRDPLHTVAELSSSNADARAVTRPIGDMMRSSAATPSLIGNTTYEPTRTVPLHESTPHHGSFPAIQNESPTLYQSQQQHGGFGFESNVSSQSTVPSNFAIKNGFPFGAAAPFLSPPGFDESKPTEIKSDIEPKQPTVDEIDDNGQDSVRSDNTSVPHELFDRDSDRDSSTSSLSDASIHTEDDQSLSHHDSSHLNEYVEEDMALHAQVEESEPDNAYNESNHEEHDVTMENCAEILIDSPLESDSKHQTSSDNFQEGTSPSKSASRNNRRSAPHNRKGNKQTNAVDSPKKSAERATQKMCQNDAQAPLEWIMTNTRWLLTSLLGALKSGAEMTVAFYRFTLSLWSRFRWFLREGLLLTTLRCMGILVSIIALVWKSALLEARQEPRMAFRFAVMYLTPFCLSSLMAHIYLPHWTPHLVSSVVMYRLLRPDKRMQENLDQFRHVQKVVELAPMRRQEKAFLGKIERAISGWQLCEAFLRYLRYFVPFMSLEAGFSVEFEPLGPCGRIITAYVLTIASMGCLLSPIAWLSLALQLLMSEYFYWIPTIELHILVVGLASLRFVVFLQKQAVASILSKGKDY